jgi:hypothetical protein
MRLRTSIMPAVLIAVAGLGAAHASGFALAELSIAGLSEADALVANTASMGALAYNPAAMAFHKGGYDLGLLGIDAHTQVTPTGEGTYHIVGDLTLHGQTHPVELEAEVSRPIQDPMGNLRVGIEATGKLNRKDWGITWNVALEAGGLMVSETVSIHIESEAYQEKK